MRQVIVIDTVRIMIVDAVPIVRYGLRSYLEGVDGVAVKAEAGSAAEALDLIKIQKPDIVLADPSFLSKQSITDIRQLIHGFGGKLLAYSSSRDVEHARLFLEMGGDGFASKQASLDELQEAIRAVAKGILYLSPSLVKDISDEQKISLSALHILSDREIEVVKLVVEGYTSAQIADRLCISRRTVETHRRNVMKKLCIQSRAELVMFARTYRLNQQK